MPSHLYRRPGSDNWWLDIKVKDRKRIRRSSGTPDKPRAQALADKIEAQEWERLVKGDPAALTFAEAVNMYVADGHGKAYLVPLLKHFKDMKVADIKPGHIRAAARALYPDLKTSTWNRQVVTPARAVINYAASKEMAAYIKVKNFPELRTMRPPPSSDWLPRFMGAAPATLAALALFMRVTGARVGQAIGVDWKAVNLAEGHVVVPAAKGFPERLAVMTPQLVAMLANLPGDRKGRLFGYEHHWSVYKPWKKACKAAGIPYVTTHPAGRRAFATTMARAKVDAKTAAQRGGWKSVRLMLDIYTEADQAPDLIENVFGTFESQSPPSKKAEGE